MKNIYYDITDIEGCIGIITSDGRETRQATQAGTTVYSMSTRDKNRQYCEFAEKHDINFIFNDDIPVIDFYAVPRIDIFAKDTLGGFFGTVGNTSGTESSEPICYIDQNRKCFTIASDMIEFIKTADTGGSWRKNMTENKDIALFNAKEDAEKYFEFIEIDIG